MCGGGWREGCLQSLLMWSLSVVVCLVVSPAGGWGGVGGGDSGAHCHLLLFSVLSLFSSLSFPPPPPPSLPSFSSSLFPSSPV